MSKYMWCLMNCVRVEYITVDNSFGGKVCINAGM